MAIVLPRVIQINTSHGGIPKSPVQKARVSQTRVEEDDWNDKKHHGFRDQAICLYSLELIEELKIEGYPLFPGALGENFTTEGVDYRKVRIGDVWDIGDQVSIRITRIRVPCRTITVYGEGIIRALYDLDVKRGNVHSTKWGRSGFYAEVLHAGTVCPGDGIIVRNVDPTLSGHDAPSGEIRPLPPVDVT